MLAICSALVPAAPAHAADLRQAMQVRLQILPRCAADTTPAAGHATLRLTCPDGHAWRVRAQGGHIEGSTAQITRAGIGSVRKLIVHGRALGATNTENTSSPRDPVVITVAF